MTIHLFILQSLVSAALYTHVKQGGGPEYQRISYTDLRAQVAFLSQLFRGEFIFPTEGLDHNLSKTLDGLEADNVIRITRTDAADEKSEIQWIELSPAERESGRENFDFYLFLIWPFIEAAWLGAMSLMMLTPPLTHGIKSTDTSWLEMKKVQDHAQLFGKTLYHQGDLSYFEAVNKETLKNAYTRFEEEGMVIVTKPKDKSPAMIRLADDWMPVRGTKGIIAEGPLWRFADRISSSRREGKNRRDGATVQSRVLNLADVVGKGLWEDAMLDGSEVKPQGSEKKAKKGRRGVLAML